MALDIGQQRFVRCVFSALPGESFVECHTQLPPLAVIGPLAAFRVPDARINPGQQQILDNVTYHQQHGGYGDQAHNYVDIDSRDGLQ